MDRFVRQILGSATMYRLVVRFLAGLLLVTILLSLLGRLHFSPTEIASTALFFIVACYLSNAAFAKFNRVKPNKESWLITALILSLIVGPMDVFVSALPLFVAAAAAMASKYFLRWNSQHIFNPAAVGLIVMYWATGTGASWWVGTMPLTLFVILGGFLIAYRIKRVRTVSAFIAAYVIFFFTLSGLALSAQDNLQLLETILLHSPLIFFATVMLVEPATSPKAPRFRYAFALTVAAIAIILQKFAADLPYSLELALLSGNLLARLGERGGRYAMILREKVRLAPTIWGFTFEPQPGINFAPGQFLEWSLPHTGADERGHRRWFTIASSPTEKFVLLSTRFSEKSSSFKNHLGQLELGSQVSAHGLEGDFVMPDDKTQPLVFIAGGIGITPFRSMVKYLLDRGQWRDIILIYAAKTEEDLVFMDIFKEAEEAFGTKIVTVISNPGPDYKGYSGQVTEELLKKEIPDRQKQLIYISGPEPMVEAIERLVVAAGVPKANIKQDFFPGYGNDLLIEKKPS
jgi:glycine betaine catabolism B